MPRYRKLSPGDTFTAGELNRMASQLTGSTGEGAGGLSVDAGSTGTNVVDHRTPPVWGRITGGTNPYSWAQVNETEESTFPDLTGDFSLSGTTTSLPAYDVDEATDVQVGSKVLLHLAASQDKWLFKSGVGATTGCDGSGPGWVAGLLTTECLYLEVLKATGKCSGVSTSQTAYMRWSGGSSAWISQQWDCSSKAWVTKNFVVDTSTSQIKFWIDAGRPRLQIAGITYDLVLTCGGNGVIVFDGGTTAACTGAAASCNNIFQVRLTCICCPIDGWQGAGWYCTKAAGGDCTALPGTVLELFETDKCSTSIKICSCRYATEAEANAQCGIAADAPCQSLNFGSAGATATFSNKTGDCTCLPTTPSTSGAGTDTLTITTASCPGNVQLDLTCSGGQYILTGSGLTTLCTAFVASPFSITFHVSNYGANCGAGGGTADLTITSP